MCRISGIIRRSPLQLGDTLQRMTTAMAHGGPDDAGLFVDEDLNVGFGHRRLSIIDLSPAGHQPMKDETAGLVICFNGEIYNFMELRIELEKSGYVFTSHSDTEVLLKGYAAWGVDLLPKLKGMFAFLLLDKNKKKVLAARDHAGIKPLYYAMQDGSLYFTSEVRGFLAANNNWAQDENWPIRFLAYGFIPEPYSTLKDVFHLPKASYLLYDLTTNEHSIHQYTQFPFSSEITDTGEAIVKTREVLLNAVERHLVADVPVGIFLSGGIDSSILTFACRHYNKEQLKTLSIYFDDEKYSEKYYQDLVIKKTGVSHQSFLVSQPAFEESLPDIFKAMDQPSIDGINSYFITRYAREYGLKVVLSGLGADELFGGYPMFNNSRYSQIKKMRLAAKIASSFIQSYPAKKLQYIQQGNPLEQYLFSRGIFVPSDISRMLDIPREQVWNVITQNGYEQLKQADSGNTVSMLEQNVYMQNQLLRDSDIYSMWHSIELRVPFLDVDVIKLAHSIAPSVKFNLQQKKYLLIQAFLQELPEEVWNRPKMGFTFPFQNWFKESRYLQQAEKKLPELEDSRRDFDKGKMNWARYWSKVVSANFADKMSA
jgi:asparagine synthase (glutamine-hydrolysing)